MEIDIMKRLTAVFEQAEEGGYVCWFKEVPEAMSQGKTLKEASANLINALSLLQECD
jgi:predicted RNase H-like HicB family nuclease